MEFLLKLEAVLKERKEQLPEKSYTANLFRDGEDRILKKITEEAGEVLLASKNHDHKEIVHESAKGFTENYYAKDQNQRPCR